ncbi:hypothetical protein CR513_50850, partial [Mucuna pruriens]
MVQRQTPLTKDKWQSMEEWLHAIEGGNQFGLEAVDLCLVSDVDLPTDKTPKFNKYKGSSYPRVHLAMYYRKMTAYIYNYKILVHFFQDSLTGVALGWYVGLERGCVKTWRDLAKAFLKQYKYNEDMAPNRSRLQNMVKREEEGFKEYTQRWHELAAQVQPPITEREMVTIFIDTLSSPYYDKVVGSVASNFAELVVVGKRIELGIKPNNNVGFIKKLPLEKKKGKANAVLIEPGKGTTSSYLVQFPVEVGSTTAHASSPLTP